MVGKQCNRGRNRFSHRKWEFALWRVRVLTLATLAGESYHRVGCESSHRLGWEFSMWWVKVWIREWESHCGRWNVGESSHSLGWCFPLEYVTVSLTVVGESCQSWVKVLTLWGDIFNWSVWEFSLVYVWRVTVLTVLGESFHPIGWEFSMWWVKFRIRGWESHCGWWKLSVWVKVLTLWDDVFHWSMWVLSLVYYSMYDQWDFSLKWVRLT